MKRKIRRRDFIKSSAIVGTTTLSATSGAYALANEEKKSNLNIGKKTITPPSEVKRIQLLENDIIRVQIFSDGSLKVMDKVNNQEWETFKAAIQDETVIRDSLLWGRSGRSMGEQFPGRFIGKQEGDILNFQLYGRQNKYYGSFRCQFLLDEDWLRIKILDVDDSLPSLVFPPPFKNDALVLPIEGGKILKNDSSSIYSGIYSRQYLQFFDALGMRFVSGLQGENGWICAFDIKTANAGGMLVNGHVAPAWVRSMGKWQGHYEVKYSFTGGGYVGIAKRYRQFAIKNGFFKSLKDKIAENPEAGKLLGGRALQFMNFKGKGYEDTQDDYWATDKQVSSYQDDHILFTFKDVMEKVKYAEKNMKFNKGMVLLRGWMHGGYDASHPDIWPVSSKLGTEEELKQIMNLSDKYVTVLHDNYQDFYPTTESFPKGVVVRENGELMSGGLWFGKQCYITNSRDGVKFAKRNWEKVKTLEPSGYFVDCVPNNPLHESYEKGNEQTRFQDMQNKFGILKVFHDHDLVIGSERFGDFCVPILHWLEHSQSRIQGESIPLWQLVFHDAVFTCNYDTFNPHRSYPTRLEDMIYGNFLRFWIPTNFGTDKPLNCEYLTGWGSWEYTKEDFLNTYHVDEWHEKIGLEEMNSHAFLTEDMKVEEAVYGNKYKIIVNFDDKPREVNGKVLKPHDYQIEG